MRFSAVDFTFLIIKRKFLDEKEISRKYWLKRTKIQSFTHTLPRFYAVT